MLNKKRKKQQQPGIQGQMQHGILHLRGLQITNYMPRNICKYM